MIKKRNLDNSLIQWIMTQTGLGPGIGQIKYVAAATSATSQFRSQLEANGVSSGDIFTSLSAAEAATVAYRNDVVLVAPGAHVETVELDWDKAWTHILGLSGPNNWGDYYEPNATIYSVTTDVVNVLHVTGACAQIQNLGINNAGANAACETPLLVDIYGCYFKNVGLMGNMTTEQCADIDCCSLRLYTNAHTAIFENCSIGQDVWGIRTMANSGQVIVDGSQMNDVLFRNSIFRSICDTATDGAMFAAQGGVGTTQFGRGYLIIAPYTITQLPKPL